MAFIVFGLAIGGLLLIMGIPKNRARLLFYATLTGLILYCMTFAGAQFKDWYHSRYWANIEYNEYFINENTSYPLQEKQAFKMLMDKYTNPNDLSLTGKSVTRYDSMVGKAKTDAFVVEFVYYRKHKKDRYKSSYTIVGDHGKFNYFDLPLSDSEEHRLDSLGNEDLKDELKAILDDSTKLSLDSAAKATIRAKLK